MDFVPGDIVLFSGNASVSRRIQQAIGSRWTQVGLIVWPQRFLEPCIFEATGISESVDVELGRVISGVQIARLADRIRAFGGEIASRKLAPALSRQATLQLDQFAERVHALPYDSNKWSVARALRRRNRAPESSGFFCSQLVAAAYQHIGLLPDPPAGMHANNYVPPDFSSTYFRRVLPLQNGFQLRDEVTIKAERGATE
jgi:hypothetical protein